MNELCEQILHAASSADIVFRSITEDVSRQPVLAGGWSRKQVVGHLIDSACNNHQRFVRAMLQESLDFPGYDQEGWVRVQAVERVPWPLLVSLWVKYNQLLAHVIGGIPASSLETTCRIGDGDPVTLGFLAKDYLRHMLHHLRQLGAAAASE